MSIVFDKSLETGNALIDEQHKELIDRVNKLVEATDAKEKNIAIQTLDFLMDYTKEHFADEEKLQESAKYPQYEIHKAEHAKFIQAVEDLEEMLNEEEGPSDAFVEAVKKNVEEWLVNHIKGWDTKVAEYVHGK